MAKKALNRRPKYTCPICGQPGMVSKRGMKRHCTIVHPEYNGFEKIWADSQRLLDSAPLQRGYMPVRKMVKLDEDKPQAKVQVPKKPWISPELVLVYKVLFLSFILTMLLVCLCFNLLPFVGPLWALVITFFVLVVGVPPIVMRFVRNLDKKETS